MFKASYIRKASDHTSCGLGLGSCGSGPTVVRYIFMAICLIAIAYSISVPASKVPPCANRDPEDRSALNTFRSK